VVRVGGGCTSDAKWCATQDRPLVACPIAIGPPSVRGGSNSGAMCLVVCAFLSCPLQPLSPSPPPPPAPLPPLRGRCSRRGASPRWAPVLPVHRQLGTLARPLRRPRVRPFPSDAHRYLSVSFFISFSSVLLWCLPPAPLSSSARWRNMRTLFLVSGGDSRSTSGARSNDA